MSTTGSDIRLVDAEAAAKLTDQEWVELHVPRFAGMRSHYASYRNFLEEVLKAFCARVAPLAIVQARAKGVPSFAEKILRKRAVYQDPTDTLPPDPLVRLTDLCGGRVITQTSDQVQAVCSLIEQAFDIDWKNSDDASKRLKTSEFGYRTVNYIVMVNPDKLKAAGVVLVVPPELLGPVCPEAGAPLRLKAEVQVRTLLEHAYADIGHDMTYKTAVKVPERITRAFSALAAVLEGTDQGFARLVHAFDDFKSNFGAYHTRTQVEQEIARLRVVLSCNKENVAQAVRIAELALAIGNHDQAIDVLAPYRDLPQQGVQRVLGTALTELHWDQPRSSEFCTGRALLQAACGHPEQDAEVLCALAECWAQGDDDNKAGACFHAAVAADATEPRTLARYLEFEVGRHGHTDLIDLASPMIQAAMKRCRTQIEGRVNLPAAWSSLAVFHLVSGQPFEALDALAHLFILCETPAGAPAQRPARPCAAGRALLRLRASLSHLRAIEQKLPGFTWFELLLTVGLAVRVRDAEALEQIKSQASWTRDGLAAYLKPDDKIVMLSGGCDAAVEYLMPDFRQLFVDASANLSFTLFSGGTKMGVSGVAGDAAEASGGKIRAIGYLPQTLPRSVHPDENSKRYALLVSSPGSDFTPLDPLQGWVDLIAAGVPPQQVKLLSYCGGPISRTELVMALLLGARVGLVDDAELPKERQVTDASWLEHSSLIRLPKDRMTLRAFLLIDELPLGEKEQQQLERAARHAHEEYVKAATPKEPNLQPWDKLGADLKLSNYHQVAYWEKMLSEKGLAVRPLTEDDKRRAPLNMADVVGEQGILVLAEMEHGRWNVERLARGWRSAPEKNVAKKLSPYLVPWRLLTDEIKGYDISAIRNLPAAMREVGLEVYRF